MKTKMKRDWSFTASWQIVGGWVGAKVWPAAACWSSTALLIAPPHTHTLQHRAQKKLHSKQSNTQPTLRTQDRAAQDRAHSSTLFYCCRREARPKGPEPALHYFYPDPLYPALSSYLELWKHSCKLFLAKKGRVETIQKFWCDEVSQQRTTAAAAAFVSLCKKHW